MNIIKLVVMVFMLSVSIGCAASKSSCNQKDGNKFVSAGNYDQGFKLLRSCESDKSVTGLTLGQLAVLYAEFGYGDFKSQAERAQKIYDLYVMSAIKGNEDAVMTLIDIFESGEPLISLKPKPLISSCLNGLVDAEDYRSSKIKSCIKED